MAVKIQDSEGDVMAEINITPFTDVLLVLLIIFMIAATGVVQTGFNLNLPKAQQTTSEADPDNIIVSIAVPAQVSVNGTGVPQAELEALLRRLKENKSTDHVIIMAEGNVEYAEVIRVMDTAKAAGLTQIAMAANPKDASP